MTRVLARNLLLLSLIATPTAAPAHGEATSGESTQLRPSPAVVEDAVRDFVAARRPSPSIPRSPALDGLARSKAEEVAARPHAERLADASDLRADVKSVGITRYRTVRKYQDMLRGYRDPAARFQQSWSNQASAWKQAMDPTVDAMGIGAARGEDGWWVLIGILLEGSTQEFKVTDLERGTFDAVNLERSRRGLPELRANEQLATVARGHSDDMIRRDYFDHLDPTGRAAPDRVRAAGIRFTLVGENIFMVRGVADIPTEAVHGWMASKGHRENILTEQFTESGMGVAVAEDGSVYITQLFLGARKD